MASYFITGTSRGVGLATVKELLLRPASEVSKIIAAARSESEALQKVVSESHGRVEFVALDVLDEGQIKKAAELASGILGDKGLDVLINNAGVTGSATSLAAMTELNYVFNVNVLGVHRVTLALVPLLERGKLKKVINIGTTVGSITHAALLKDLPLPAYKISKAALHMLTVQWHLDKYDQGFTIFAITPGWVKTDLGGEYADLELDESIPVFVKRCVDASREDSGKLLNVRIEGWENGKPGKLHWYDGKEVPW